jgi:hypothetical protein
LLIICDTATRSLDSGKQRWLRQTKVEADHIGSCRFDDQTHSVTERREIDTGRRRGDIEPQLAVISLQADRATPLRGGNWLAGVWQKKLTLNGLLVSARSFLIASIIDWAAIRRRSGHISDLPSLPASELPQPS